MRVGAIHPFSPASPVTHAAAVAAIGRDGRLAPAIVKRKEHSAQRKRDPIKAARDPAASSSSSARTILDGLRLGG